MSIDEYFEIFELFDEINEEIDLLKKGEYRLKALICYYGRHYVSFCFSKKLNQWLLINDSSLKIVGLLWSDVIKICLSALYQPYLLFYSADNPTKLNTSEAPKKIVFI